MPDAATVVAVPLLLRQLIAEAKTKADEYDDDQIKQLQQIANYYSQYCSQHELGMTVNFSGIGDNLSIVDSSLPAYQEQSPNPIIPQYFQLQQKNKKLPALYDPESRGLSFTICTDANEWTRRMGRSHLFTTIEEVFAPLCEYQRSRKESNTSYDPINLFFEELKAWFLQLSYAPLDSQAVIDSMSARISYLQAIIFDTTGLFDKKKSITGTVIIEDRKKIKKVVDHVNKLLENIIKPIAENCLSRRSAREHFDQLRLQLQISIKNLLKFLFYMLGEHKISPNFSLEKIRQTTFFSDESAQNSVLTAIFKHLVKSDIFTAVFPTLSAKKTTDTQTATASDSLICRRDELHLAQNDFLNQNNTPRLPRLTEPNFQNLTIEQCTIQQDTDSYKVGIFPEFRTAEYITHFLVLCGHIQQLCLYYLIADEFFDLAGDGGDILVYGMAAPVLRPALDHFKQLSMRVTKLANTLYTAATTLFMQHELASTNTNADTQTDPVATAFPGWRPNFTVAQQARDDPTFLLGRFASCDRWNTQFYAVCCR